MASLSRATISNVTYALGCGRIAGVTALDQGGDGDRGPESVSRSARARVRAEITREILEAGRRHLATEGAPALSLRAIARDLGMASSALYRYVASRDDLLTRLIIEAYDSLGEAVEAREARALRVDFVSRFAALCEGVRSWAAAHPNEYALIYGSPVPGYAAPPETIAPASRVSLLLARMLIEAAESGQLTGVATSDAVPPMVSSALDPVRPFLPAPVPAGLLQVGLMVWTGLFGMVSFELFGQLHNVVGEQPGDREAFFAECVRRWADQLGLISRQPLG